MPRINTSNSAAFSRRRRIIAPLCYLIALVFAFQLPLVAVQPALAAKNAAPTIPLRPFAYATANSATGYDIMVGDGVKKDSRVAKVKVDSTFFTDVSARLSADASQVAFRVTGDRNGGSSLYSVNIASGKFTQVAASKSAAEGMGRYIWSPAGNTMAFVRSAPALDPAAMDGAYGTIYVYSVGFEAVKLKSSLGDDRLLGFSNDGLGVYVARHETKGNFELEHLVYLPLSGSSTYVMIKSQPALRYSHFTLVAANKSVRVAYLAEGDFTLAAQNSNVHEVAPLVKAPIVVDGVVNTKGELTRPTGMGLVASDTVGLHQTLLRRDADDYAQLSWSPDGGFILAGSNKGSWSIAMDGSKTSLGTSVTTLQPAAASSSGTYVVMSDNPTTRLVTIDYSTGKVSATKYVGITPKAGNAVVKLAVPYIHQVNDTAPYADGDWACGPTSVVMALAYYGKVEPWSTTQNALLEGAGAGEPTRVPTGADYAQYVTSEYTNNGHTYSATARDASGNAIAGLYGTICPTGTASWPVMSEVLSWHGLDSQRIGATWDGIVAALKRGHPVLLGNKLTSQGHILVVIGYTNDGNLVVNDPYGNKFAPGYGSNDGKGILYPWKRVTPRTAVEVIGTWPVPTATPVPPTKTSTATVTATPSPSATAVDTAVPAETVGPTEVILP